MTKIYINHEFSDQRIGKVEVKSLNMDGNPDYVDIPVKFGNLKKVISLTTSDIVALARALRLTNE